MTRNRMTRETAHIRYEATTERKATIRSDACPAKRKEQDDGTKEEKQRGLEEVEDRQKYVRLKTEKRTSASTGDAKLDVHPSETDRKMPRDATGEREVRKSATWWKATRTLWEAARSSNHGRAVTTNPSACRKERRDGNPLNGN